MPTRKKPNDEWTLDPGLVLLNLGSAIRPPPSAWDAIKSLKPSEKARHLARSAGTRYFAAIARSNGASSKEARQIADKQSSDPDWIARAQMADHLCHQYKEAIVAFSKALNLTRDQRYAVQRQFDVMRLIEVCEAAQIWTRNNDEGLQYRQQGLLRWESKREEFCQSLRIMSLKIRENSAALAQATSIALREARLTGSTETTPSNALSNLILRLLPQGPERFARLQKIAKDLSDSLLDHGLDIRAADEHVHARQRGSAFLSAAFPGQPSAPRRLSLALDALERAIRRQADEARLEKRTDKFVPFVRIGNLEMVGDNPYIPKGMPRTGLLAELMMMLTEIGAFPTGEWRPLPHLWYVPVPLYPSHVLVASKFISAALKDDYSNRAANSAMTEILNHAKNIRLVGWFDTQVSLRNEQRYLTL